MVPYLVALVVCVAIWIPMLGTGELLDDRFDLPAEIQDLLAKKDSAAG